MICTPGPGDDVEDGYIYHVRAGIAHPAVMPAFPFDRPDTANIYHKQVKMGLTVIISKSETRK